MESASQLSNTQGVHPGKNPSDEAGAVCEAHPKSSWPKTSSARGKARKPARQATGKRLFPQRESQSATMRGGPGLTLGEAGQPAYGISSAREMDWTWSGPGEAACHPNLITSERARNWRRARAGLTSTERPNLEHKRSITSGKSRSGRWAEDRGERGTRRCCADRSRNQQAS